MRLRKPCEHDRYEEHPIGADNDVSRKYPLATRWCPGGEFLPEDALVIERVEGEWPKSAKNIIHKWWTENLRHPNDHPASVLLNALADQVGEPG